METLSYMQHSSGLQSCETSWPPARPHQTGIRLSGLSPSGCSTAGASLGQGALSAALRASDAGGDPPAGRSPFTVEHRSISHTICSVPSMPNTL